MKTLYLSQRLPYPPNKGEKIRTFYQIEYLLKNDHSIYLCCPYTSSDELKLFEEFSDKYQVPVTTHKLGSTYLRYFTGLLKLKPLSVSNFYSRQLQKIFDQLIMEESFQNIVCTCSSMAEYVFNSSSLPNLNRQPQLFMDFMDLDSDKWRQYSETSSFPMKWVYTREAKLLSSYEFRVYQNFDTCFFTSQAEVDLFCRNNPCTEQPLAIGVGIDDEVLAPAKHAPHNENPVFIFTGVMDYKPNIESVLWFTHNVWPGIIAKYSKSRFIIAGMNPVQSVQDLDKIKGIEVTGFVDDILPYYHASDFFVAPLRIARGVQIKILQAFACGLPVIATTMGAEGIDYKDGENIMIADTADEFIQKIELLIDDKNRYETVKDNALQLICNKYSRDAMLSSLGKILN